jgi:hypothetical protein
MMPPAFWLFLRCVLWGLATGAAGGATVGALIGVAFATDNGLGLVDTLSGVEIDGAAALVVITTAIGAAYGAVFAILPSVLGGLAVTQVTRRRHPQPASPPAVRHDLGLMILAVAILTNAVFIPIIVTGDENGAIGAYFVGLLVANVSGAPVLWWARSSITKMWAGTSR